MTPPICTYNSYHFLILDRQYIPVNTTVCPRNLDPFYLSVTKFTANLCYICLSICGILKQMQYRFAYNFGTLSSFSYYIKWIQKCFDLQYNKNISSSWALRKLIVSITLKVQNKMFVNQELILNILFIIWIFFNLYI